MFCCFLVVIFFRMEDQTDGDDSDIKKNFMDHKIKSLLSDKWDLECTAALKHVFRLDSIYIGKEERNFDLS